MCIAGGKNLIAELNIFLVQNCHLQQAEELSSSNFYELNEMKWNENKPFGGGVTEQCKNRCDMFALHILPESKLLSKDAKKLLRLRQELVCVSEEDLPFVLSTVLAACDTLWCLLIVEICRCCRSIFIFRYLCFPKWCGKSHPEMIKKRIFLRKDLDSNYKSDFSVCWNGDSFVYFWTFNRRKTY